MRPEHTSSARRIRAAASTVPTVVFMVIASACGGSSANPIGPTSMANESPASSSPSTTTPDPRVSTSPLAYDPDIKAILQSDCVKCHGTGASGGFSVTTYAGVMAAVRPGDAQSLLVTYTQPGGCMYCHLSGDRDVRSGMIRDWVVTFDATAAR